MNSTLTDILNSFTDIMKNTDGVLGAWNFGSAVHGLSDEYSDADIVFLIKGTEFGKIEQALLPMLSTVCDEVLLCWEESFNSAAIINNGYLLKKGGEIFQFDIFLINNDMIGDFMCRIHYTDLSEKDIIFDTDGCVKKLCADCPHGSLWNDNIDRLIRTYWYHANMTAKYLLRKDYFKLNHAMGLLFDTHTSLLLTGYDKIKWGGAENKLNFIPHEKQEHLKRYYCTEDFKQDRSNLMKSFEWFETDLRDVCLIKSFDYNSAIGNNVKEYWMKLTQNI